LGGQGGNVRTYLIVKDFGIDPTSSNELVAKIFI